MLNSGQFFLNSLSLFQCRDNIIFSQAIFKTISVLGVKHANHLVHSQISFKKEMYLCEMTHTDCSACLQENANFDMSFSFVSSFMALQSSMMVNLHIC